MATLAASRSRFVVDQPLFARNCTIPPASHIRYVDCIVDGWVLMSLVRLLGFSTMNCGCVSGRYREMGTSREITYIGEKGTGCGNAGHQRNQPVSADRVAHGFAATGTARVS